MNARAMPRASSGEIGGFRTMNATCSLNIPMPPTGRTKVTEKIASHFPRGLLKQ